MQIFDKIKSSQQPIVTTVGKYPYEITHIIITFNHLNHINWS